MKILNLILFTLIFIGGLNWGLVGIFQLDLVALLFGDMSIIARMVYALVGVAALISAFTILPAIAKED